MLSKIRILHIDDDPDEAFFLREVAGDADLVHVDTLGLGIDLLKNRKFDVILLDIILPDTFDRCEGMRRLQAVTDIPVVVLSGSINSDFIRDIYINHHPLTVLEKPVSKEQLSAVLLGLK